MEVQFVIALVIGLACIYASGMGIELYICICKTTLSTFSSPISPILPCLSVFFEVAISFFLNFGFTYPRFKLVVYARKNKTESASLLFFTSFLRSRKLTNLLYTWDHVLSALRMFTELPWMSGTFCKNGTWNSGCASRNLDNSRSCTRQKVDSHI